MHHGMGCQEGGKNLPSAHWAMPDRVATQNHLYKKCWGVKKTSYPRILQHPASLLVMDERRVKGYISFLSWMGN